MDMQLSLNVASMPVSGERLAWVQSACVGKTTEVEHVEDCQLFPPILRAEGSRECR